jgi:hypothetical protein
LLIFLNTSSQQKLKGHFTYQTRKLSAQSMSPTSKKWNLHQTRKIYKKNRFPSPNPSALSKRRRRERSRLFSSWRSCKLLILIYPALQNVICCGAFRGSSEGKPGML